MRKGLYSVGTGLNFSKRIFNFFLNSYSFFRDKDGHKLLVFCVFKHIKGQEKMEDMKRFFVYMLERLNREEGGEQITLLFDCRWDTRHNNHNAKT